MSLRLLVLPYAVQIDFGGKSPRKKCQLNEYALSFFTLTAAFSCNCHFRRRQKEILE